MAVHIVGFIFGSENTNITSLFTYLFIYLYYNVPRDSISVSFAQTTRDGIMERFYTLCRFKSGKVIGISNPLTLPFKATSKTEAKQ